MSEKFDIAESLREIEHKIKHVFVTEYGIKGDTLDDVLQDLRLKWWQFCISGKYQPLHPKQQNAFQWLWVKRRGIEFLRVYCNQPKIYSLNSDDEGQFAYDPEATILDAIELSSLLNGSEELIDEVKNIARGGKPSAADVRLIRNLLSGSELDPLDEDGIEC